MRIYSNQLIGMIVYKLKIISNTYMRKLEVICMPIKVKSNYELSFKVDQTIFSRPSLFLLGRQDSSVGYKDALNLMEYYPRGTFTILDIAGHNLQIEQPQLFNSLVNEWLDRIEELL